MRKILIFCLFSLVILSNRASFGVQYELTIANQTFNLSDSSVTFDIYIRTTNSGDTIFLATSDIYFRFNVTFFKNLYLTYAGNTSNFINRKGVDCSSWYSIYDPQLISDSSYDIYINGPDPGNLTDFTNKAARITNQSLTHRIGTFKVQTVTSNAVRYGYPFGLIWQGTLVSESVGIFSYSTVSPFMASQLNGTLDPIVPNLPMPVALSYFNSRIYNNSVKLMWETTYECNNANFIIERIISGSNTWTKVGTIPGHGNSNSPVKYLFEDSKLSANVYNYRLKQVDYNGNFEFFSLSQPVSIGKPGTFLLEQNYPNPSNPKAIIDYQIPFDSHVKMVVYDLIGREVIKLVDENKQAGYYSAIFDGTNLASGIYIYRIAAENSFSKFEKSMKMALIK